MVNTRYFIFLTYKGTNYHGWQIQPNNLTVQQIVEEALSVVLSEKISTTGAGRTDTGVHARFFCAHFESLCNDLDKRHNLIHRLNSFLPKDISVFSIRKVVPDANARFSATSRTYRYYISTVKDPFTDSFSWYLFGKIDIEAMNIAAQKLLAHSDFTSFSRLHSGSKTNICNIYSAKWQKIDKQIIFTIKADRFLRNMVRAIVGTMAEVGTNRITPEKFEGIILTKDRCKAGKSAPAKGLFLEDIEYPKEIFSA